MIVERVIWTALPAGFDAEGRLRLSVHVGPRLTTDDGDPSPRHLAEFGAFERWPEQLSHLRFRAVFDSGLVVDAAPVESADTDLWTRVFPPETLVRPHAFEDHAKRSLHAFPARDVLRFLRETYGNLSAAGPNLPSIDGPNPLTAAFGPLAGLTDLVGDSSSFWDEVARAYDKPAERPDGTVVTEHAGDASLSPAQQAARGALFAAYRFYYRPASRGPGRAGQAEKPAPVPDLEFHELVALLADHPVLLRRLGLVVDLVLDVAEPIAMVPPAGVVRVELEGDLPEAPPRTPGTRYEVAKGWFGARPAQAWAIARGLVRLTEEFWDLFQVDVDGGALQAVGFGDTLARLQDPERRSEASPDQAGAPALRSGGLSLARSRRADGLLLAFKDRRAKNAKLEIGSAVTFDAEDLVRGYRVDVFDADAPDGERWYSLHERIAHHRVGLPADGDVVELEPIADEGYIKATSASSEREDHENASDDLYLHETVASWDGWSLAAPRPGKRIVEPGEGEDGGASPLARHDPSAGQLRALVSTLEVAPGSLPRLRVGHTYRVRMRTVDLAGNSRPFSPEDLEPQVPDLVSEPQRYVRFEPVPSPTVLRRHLDTEGESLEHLVIRSNFDATAGQYAASAAVKEALAQAGAAHAYAADSQRHLAPPKGSFQQAEQDGRFDAAIGGPPAARTAGLRVALREEGTFLDPEIVDLGTGQKSVAQSTIALHPPGTTLPTVRGAGLGATESGAYAFYPDGSVALPYLPDPLAVGISLTGYDHTGVEVFHRIVPFGGAWPALEPFRIRLLEGTLGVGVAGGVLEVRLPKAEVIRARLSSVFADGRLDDLAIWEWTPGPARTDTLIKAAQAGRHWMLTPFRPLTLTHAVQQPLAVPDMTKVTLTRALGRTYADFHGPIANHAKSTGRLDVVGAWTEDVDLLTDDAPRAARFGTGVEHSAQAFGFDLRTTEDQAYVSVIGAGHDRLSRHEFGDTKYRRIVYHSVATTRFREYLPRPIADDPARIQREEPWQDATGGWRTELVRDVPSSARPAAPDVLYALPTFRWQKDDESPVRTHVRRGNGIRVWLRRPWFSSGDGELLGVVLEPAPKLPRPWLTVPAELNLTALELARRKPIVSQVPVRRAAPATRAIGRQPSPAVKAAPAAAAKAVPVGQAIETGLILGPILGGRVPPDAQEIARMLRPYVTSWGSDPVWASRLPDLPPTVADFPRHVAWAAGLTLEELAPEARVVVAGHEVHYDTARRLWYCDVEVDAGAAYFPFVRLALARYQPHSVEGAHLSRVSVADFVQLAPDRTAEVSADGETASVTVRGPGGENLLARAGSTLIPDVALPGEGPAPNTEMRVALQRRRPGVPGDLGWEPVREVRLDASAAGWSVTWSGSVPLADPAAPDAEHRLLVTEVETFPRDMLPTDPRSMTSIRDFVRERVVYADEFVL